MVDVLVLSSYMVVDGVFLALSRDRRILSRAPIARSSEKAIKLKVKVGRPTVVRASRVRSGGGRLSEMTMTLEVNWFEGR